jgi:transposase-like protein
MTNLTLPIFTDAEKAREHMEAIYWPEGPVCPHCGVVNEATLVKGKSHRPGLYQCNACRKPFSVTVGTVMEKSHIPLNKWVLGFHLMASSKKGISAHQLHRTLGITYKAAWFMAHRIRAAMDPLHNGLVPPDMGGQGKVVEIDETELTLSKKSRKRVAPIANPKIVSLVDRTGQTRSLVVMEKDKRTLQLIVKANVRKESRHYTDEAMVYRNNKMELDGGHASVNHDKHEYARGDVHTQTVEGFFSIFKRGMVGTYQHCGEQHLRRYLAEFDFRASNRASLGVNDEVRATRAIKGAEGKRLTYNTVSG